MSTHWKAKNTVRGHGERQRQKRTFALHQGSPVVIRGAVDHSNFPTAFPHTIDDYSVQLRNGQPFCVTGGHTELWLWTCSGQRFGL
ncbi:hypothetical protein JMJ77_0001298 [Colletotrichum scovillei]|uniref:Uncharacterized protein n=1 Tax=Colletotrichum scovillei TaxID=1209932 RepID=A0A9P7REL8_9PEZI|nr:hypothetical protein JMJ77_0001298 [Colletotrichum scovillei]KAG7072525.1 hypothetical protein JMJ76_0005374 [Colletotrichum scovillei]KAG7080706.1 hypothetical protein JMJ78_0007792 [Colletotrichum scovillei]